jgi:hypothetical protein
MDIKAEIKSLKKELDKIEDKHLIQAIKNLLTYAQKRDEIVGYEADGTPITKEQLGKEVEESNKEIEKGNYYTQEQTEKEAQQW